MNDPTATNAAGWFTRTYTYSTTIPHAVTNVTPETGSPDTYSYDANGNMTCRVEGGVTFKQDYNAENRISAIHKLALSEGEVMNGTCSAGTVTESWLYGYDGDGVRVSTAHYTGVTQDSLTAYYMGGAYEVTGSAVKKYYSIAGQTIMRDSDGSLKYLLTDHLGSTSAVTNQNGTLLSQQRYLPFGEVRTDTNPPYITQTDLTYTGQRNLSGTVLMDYRARFYSVSLGRFIQPDSIVPNPANPQAYNRYSYTINNPILFTDPTGHEYCGPDNIYCGGLAENDYYSRPRPGGNSGGRDGDDLDTDTNDNGVPDIPDPDAVIPPANYDNCQLTLIECLYTGGLLPDGDISITDEEWDQFTLALFYDIYRRANEGDGFWTIRTPETVRYNVPFVVPLHTEAYHHRAVYDTPFWNGGVHTGNVCFENGKCSDRNDVNYVAQGMWSAAAHEGPLGAYTSAIAWKLSIRSSPNLDTLYWAGTGAVEYQYYETTTLFGLLIP
ncbi:MAG: RHS repeat-associated core domain-containing protein [Chloroflexota bacterium]